MKRATALGIAVHYNCRASVQLLIDEYGADVNAVSDDAGHTPVSQACAAGDFDTAKLLLSVGGRLHSTIAGSSQNPLHEAVAACDSALVIEVLQLDTEYCARSGSSSVQLLAQQDSIGRTPLHLCAALPASGPDVPIMWEQMLNTAGIAMLVSAARQQDAAGRTVLHVLLEYSLQLLQSYLHAKASAGCLHTVLGIEDISGTTPVVLAQRIGCQAITAALAQYAPEVAHKYAHATTSMRADRPYYVQLRAHCLTRCLRTTNSLAQLLFAALRHLCSGKRGAQRR